MADTTDVAISDAASPDAVVAGIPDYLQFGVSDESASPPLPTADTAPEADAAAVEPQQDPAPDAVKDEAKPPVEPDPTQGAQALPEQGGATGGEGVKAVEADPELSADENQLIQSQPEAERAILAGKMKAASFMGNFLNDNKPAEEIREHLEQKSPSRYGALELSVVEKVAAEPERLERIFKANPNAYSAFAQAAFKSDPDFFIRQGTGQQDLTFEQVKAALASPNAGIPGAAELTDEEMEDIGYGSESAQAKLQAAREAAKNAPPAEAKPATTPDAKAEPEKEGEKPLTREKVLEEYQAQTETHRSTFEHGITPIGNYLEKRLNDICPEPTDKEWETAPEVAAAKELKREVLLSGAGRKLPNFTEGFKKWGEHRKLGAKGERDFDQAMSRLNTFASKGEKDGAQLAGSELIPFADAYLNERAQDAIIKALDRIIGIVDAQANRTPRIDPNIPGSANSQPPSTTKLSGDQWLLQHAQEHS